MSDSTIQNSIVEGYTDKISYTQNQKIYFYVNSKVAMSANVSIYDINGVVVDSVALELIKQNSQTSDAYKTGYDYCVSGYFIPKNNLSLGIYFLAKKIPFIYKAVGEHDIAVVYPTNTIAAYNNFGGASLYSVLGDDPNKHTASEVSFLRPIKYNQTEIDPFFKWLRVNSEFDAKSRYLSDQDMDDYHNIVGVKFLIIPGHSEYWTQQARLNLDRFVDEGHHVILLSGNTMWWQVRYGQNGDSLVCHRVGSTYGTTDPEQNPLLQTKNWFVPSLHYPIGATIGAEFRYAGYGRNHPTAKKDMNFLSKNFGGLKIVNEKSAFLANTSLKKGDVLPMFEYEMDGLPISKLNSDGVPVINDALFMPYKFDLIGYEYAFLPFTK